MPKNKGKFPPSSCTSPVLCTSTDHQFSLRGLGIVFAVGKGGKNRRRGKNDHEEEKRELARAQAAPALPMLHAAAKDGNVDQVVQLLDANVDVELTVGTRPKGQLLLPSPPHTSTTPPTHSHPYHSSTHHTQSHTTPTPNVTPALSIATVVPLLRDDRKLCPSPS